MPHAGELIPFGMLGSGVQQFLARPSSANLASAVTDETGSGALVFATSPTINNPLIGGNVFVNQGAPVSKAAAATLTLTELRTKVIQYTGAGAANLTTPTGTELDAVFAGAMPNNYGWDFSIINTGSATATLTAGVDVTLVGTMTVTAGTSGAFRTRKTATNTFTIYRMA